MDCLVCSAQNPENAKFCNQCGMELDQNAIGMQEGTIAYGSFHLWRNEWSSSFSFQRTVEGLLEWQNSPAVLSINQPEQPQFMGKIEMIDYETVKVLQWWELKWNGTAWEVGVEVTDHPHEITLSALE